MENHMKATEILMAEHRVIERVVAAMDQAALRLEAGEAVRPSFFLDAAEFVKGFADGCHHMKEEQVLFQAMVENGMSTQEGPVAVMLSEHEQGRVYIRQLREAALRLQAGDRSAVSEVTRNARGYAALLQQHITKEDLVLFPMANRVIPLAQHDVVFEGFERVEHEETGEGVHEKYLALAEALEKELA
jgi:hemerythrin-like domain-containing protein